MKKVLFLIICSISLTLSAQTNQKGIIEGKVVEGTVKDFLEGTTGDVIPNAKIIIDGTEYRAIADMEGKYIIKGINFGTYSVTVSSPGHATKILTDIIVSNNEVLNLDIALEPITTTMTDIVVKVKVSKSDEIGTLATKRNSANSSDVISATTISKTPDRTTSDVLKRVSGASIQDNKFAIIRGLNDRYNAAYLNDGPLPSSESDRKAFSFDIFPANMLDNITIVKTATPDLPAEFAGGIIQINTKSIPAKNFQSFLIGGGYNTVTTFKEQIDYKGGKLDWLGLDDGTRNLPSVIPAKVSYPILNSNQALLAKEFNTDWSVEAKKFSPNLNLQYSMGINTTLFKKEIGIITSLTYNKTNNFNQTTRRAYSGTGENGNSQLDYDYLDKVYSTQILGGIMANFTMKLNSNNKIGFKNLYSINSDDRVINRTGERDPSESNPTLLKSNALWFTTNNIYSGQLNGEHLFKKEKLKIHWVGSYSNIKRTIPNLRRSIYNRSKFHNPDNATGSDTVYTASIDNGVGPDYSGGMFFSTNKENIASFKIDLSYHLKELLGIKSEFKIGSMVQNRNRTFDARQLGYTIYGNGSSIHFKDSLKYLDQNTIFNSENMGLIKPGVGGFKLTDASKYSDAYTANSSTTSGYLMLDNKIHKILRIVWGARAEYFVQNLHAIKSDKSDLQIATKKLDVLPSLNAIYSFHKKQNFRLSYSQTLNRPEYRELAPFAFYDFNTQFVISGNDSLKRAKITNLDLRYELYPGKGQLLSGTFFYKEFENPIEQISRADVANEMSFKNVPKATNFGLEIEARTIIGSLIKADSNSITNNFTFYTNLAIIRSIVDVSDIVGTPYSSRPLQGQSPYVFNTGLTYFNEDKSLSTSINVNRVGDRISILGNINQPDIWEKSRTFVDFQVSKGFFKNKMECKLNFQNILAQKQIFYQNNYSDNTEISTGKELSNLIFNGTKRNINGYNEKVDNMIWSTVFGRVISATVTVKL